MARPLITGRFRIYCSENDICRLSGEWVNDTVLRFEWSRCWVCYWQWHYVKVPPYKVSYYVIYTIRTYPCAVRWVANLCQFYALWTSCFFQKRTPRSSSRIPVIINKPWPKFKTVINLFLNSIYLDRVIFSRSFVDMKPKSRGYHQRIMPWSREYQLIAASFKPWNVRTEEYISYFQNYIVLFITYTVIFICKHRNQKSAYTDRWFC